MNLPHSFEFPKAYLEMESRGWFSYENNYPIVKHDYRKILWMNEFRWLTREKIRGLQLVEGQVEGIVPFAKNARGDFWCWFPRVKDFGYQIAFCTHDDVEGEIYAPCFEAAIYRQILEFSSQNNFRLGVGETWELDPDDARAIIQDWLEKLSPFLNEAYVRKIASLKHLNLRLYKSTNSQGKIIQQYHVLLTPEEVTKMLDDEFGVSLNETVIWRNV